MEASGSAIIAQL
jgi:hypothetical protein